MLSCSVLNENSKNSENSTCTIKRQIKEIGTVQMRIYD